MVPVMPINYIRIKILSSLCCLLFGDSDLLSFPDVTPGSVPTARSNTLTPFHKHQDSQELRRSSKGSYYKGTLKAPTG